MTETLTMPTGIEGAIPISFVLLDRADYKIEVIKEAKPIDRGGADPTASASSTSESRSLRCSIGGR